MGRIIFLILLCFCFSSFLFAQDSGSDNQLIISLLYDINDTLSLMGGSIEDWSSLLEQTANQENWHTLLQQTANEENWLTLLNYLNDINTYTSNSSDDISSIADDIQSIYDVIQQQGGTKDDWQSLRDSLYSMQNNLYYLSTIQSDTSTMSSSVYSLYNEVMALNSTLSSKLDSMQDSDNTNFNNLLDSLGAKLDSVVNSIDQFRYFEFDITATVDFEPILHYLKQISDDGVKISGFDGDIFITNSVDLSEIILNQEEQILNQKEQITNQYEEMLYWERLEDFLGIPYYSLDEYFYTITHGNTKDWKQASLKGVTYYLWEIRKVLDSITNSVTNLRQDSELSSITENARNYINAGDYVVSNFSEITDTSYSYLTNVNKKAEITPIEYDFTPYTNVTDVINNIKDEYYYMQMMSNTNQFVSASTSVTEALNKQVESMTPLFERNYNSTIKINWDLLGVNKEIDLARYVTFDSDKFKTCWDFVIWISTILFGLKALKNIWEN